MPAPQKTVLPIDLGAAPEIDELLVKLGLGAFVRDSVTAPIGRNNAWAGRTTGGRDVFVKRLAGNEQDKEGRLSRTLAFESYITSAPLADARTPALLGSDRENRLVAFQRVTDAVNGGELMVDETFTLEQAHRVGRAIGQLHDTPPPPDVEVDDSTPPFPPLPFLRGLPMSTYVQASAGEMDAWRLLQGDQVLIEALEKLGEEDRDTPRVPSHCDFRVDQLLISGDELYIADWEEFRLADPARDVGAFAGEWVFRSVLDLVTGRGDEVFTDLEFTHELIMQRGVEKMRRLLPLVAEFWRGYVECRKEIDENLPVRATAYAGWHLLDRLVAGSVSSIRLSGIQRAAAGVGRAAVVSPEKFALTLGFGDMK